MSVQTQLSRDGSEDSLNSIHETVTKLKFFVTVFQLFTIFFVILSCILCLALGKGNSEMWISFFGLAFGAILPAPKVKKLLIEPSFHIHRKSETGKRSTTSASTEIETQV